MNFRRFPSSSSRLYTPPELAGNATSRYAPFRQAQDRLGWPYSGLHLKWRWGYPVLWAVFIGVSVFLLRFFKKKKWI
jgi:hypothetical protein